MYIFDLSKRKDHNASQPIRLEFSANIIVADYTAYTLVLTPNLVSISTRDKGISIFCNKHNKIKV